MNERDENMGVSGNSDSSLAWYDRPLWRTVGAFAIAVTLIAFGMVLQNALSARTADEPVEPSASETDEFASADSESRGPSAPVTSSPPSEGELQSASPPESEDLATPEIDSPRIFRQSDGPVVVSPGRGIDLDSQAPDWGVRGSGDTDFGVSSSGNTIFSSDRTEFAFVREVPSLAECERQTAIEPIVPLAQTVEDQKMCVYTNQGRTAYVRIASIDDERDTMSFDILVWSLDTDP